MPRPPRFSHVSVASPNSQTLKLFSVAVFAGDRARDSLVTRCEKRLGCGGKNDQDNEWSARRIAKAAHRS